MPDYDIRAFELHSLYAWDFPWIMKSMDFMVKNGFNSLVLHRNDFIDLIVYPARYFGADPDKEYQTKFDRYNDIFRTLYKYTPTRRSGPVQRRSFLKRVLLEAKKRGIRVYIETKELYFPEIILELRPGLLHDGHICANDPFWWEFTRVKYEEFFAEFPDIAGIITSAGTGESRVSVNSNRCTCELCQNASKQDWYRKLLTIMYDAITKAGATLIVRDFVFTPAAQAELAEVMAELPSDVILALKNTPHDYYPTFPDNPRIGKVGNHEQWIEFDCMGQYYGWGIGIADLLADFRRRLAFAKENGATGAIFRTDWESLDAASSFYTPNLINQYASGALMNDLDVPDAVVYRNYMEDEGWLIPGSSEREKAEAVAWFGGISSKTWGITSKTCYVDDCVFSDSSLVPLGLEHAYWLAEEKNSLRDWLPSKWEALYPTEENVRRSLAEKDAALAELDELIAAYKERRPAAVDFGRYGEYLERLAILMRRYVLYYRAAVRAIVLTRYLLETKEDRGAAFYSEAKGMIKEAVANLDAEYEISKRFSEETAYTPHVLYTLMDPDRLGALSRDLKSRLGALCR